MIVLVVLVWASLGALVWTHAAYPAFAAALARVAPRRVRRAEIEPIVTVIVAAYNEGAVIERRVANLLALDDPRDKLKVVVSADASHSSSRTHCKHGIFVHATEIAAAVVAASESGSMERGRGDRCTRQRRPRALRSPSGERAQ